MESPNLNYLWAELIVEELIRCGVGKFCISPGSRNSPLVVAAAGNPRADTLVHCDERGAAFYALGFAKATGQPAALICTSGTAVANTLPAVVEAAATGVPLVVLSADRPVALRDTGANQTIDQVGIFGPYARWHFDLPAPQAAVPASAVLTTVGQLVYRARRSPAGPVQLNCQFDEPLAPRPDESIPPTYRQDIEAWQEQRRPFTSYAPMRAEMAEATLERIRTALAGARRGVIVAGRLAAADGPAACRLAATLRWPLLADISSGIRFGDRPPSCLVTHYDLFLREKAFARRHRPDLILHLGGPLVSKALNGYLETAGVEYITVAPTPFRQDPGHTVTRRLEMQPGRFCDLVSNQQPGADSELLRVFARAEAVCAEMLDSLPAARNLDNEFAAVRQLLISLPDETGLFLANSMPVRDADGCGFTSANNVDVGVSRGASGIDGNIATATGYANGLGRRTVLLTGDLAFLHDLNSLLLVKQSAVPLTIVLLNNDGGGIFSFLPIAGYQDFFRDFFAAPHGCDFAQAATFFGLPYYGPATRDELQEDLARAFTLAESSLVEIKTERAANSEQHRIIWDQVATAIRNRLP